MMEYLNGGDLMFHIQNCHKFDLYRATYVPQKHNSDWTPLTMDNSNVVLLLPVCVFLQLLRG